MQSGVHHAEHSPKKKQQLVFWAVVSMSRFKDKDRSCKPNAIVTSLEGLFLTTFYP